MANYTLQGRAFLCRDHALERDWLERCEPLVDMLLYTGTIAKFGSTAIHMHSCQDKDTCNNVKKCMMNFILLFHC